MSETQSQNTEDGHSNAPINGTEYDTLEEIQDDLEGTLVRLEYETRADAPYDPDGETGDRKATRLGISPNLPDDVYKANPQIVLGKIVTVTERRWSWVVKLETQNGNKRTVHLGKDQLHKDFALRKDVDIHNANTYSDKSDSHDWVCVSVPTKTELIPRLE